MFNIVKKYLVSSLLLLLLLCTFTLNHLMEYLDRTEDNTYQSTIRTTKSTTVAKQNKNDDISCHDITEGDALTSVTNANFSPPENSIFFHETSCRRWLNSRQACAIESAAKAHPKKKIYVLFSGPIQKNILNSTGSSLLELKKYPNIEFARVFVREYAKGTALEHLFLKQMINRSKWKVVHTSDLIRVISMYKYGGLFLDTDIIVLRPMDSLGRNWLAKESNDAISSAALNVGQDELGREIIGKVLEEIGTSYNPDKWLHNGPDAIKRVLFKFCNTTRVGRFSKATCRGFKFVNPEIIYPVPWYEFEEPFEPGEIPEIEDAYTFHFWNHLSSNVKVQRKSPIDMLAKKHCPLIHKLYGDSFGY